jgi:hypothetical protein
MLIFQWERVNFFVSPSGFDCTSLSVPSNGRSAMNQPPFCTNYFNWRSVLIISDHLSTEESGLEDTERAPVGICYAEESLSANASVCGPRLSGL